MELNGDVNTDDDQPGSLNMRPGEPDRTRHQEGHVPLHSFLGGVASPESIKDCSLHALDQLLNSTNHMPCIWGTVNRRNMQYFTDLKCRTPILDVPPLIGHGTDGQAETQPAHHRVLVGMHQTPWVGVRRGTSRKRTCERLPYETPGVLICRVN